MTNLTEFYSGVLFAVFYCSVMIDFDIELVYIKGAQCNNFYLWDWGGCTGVTKKIKSYFHSVCMRNGFSCQITLIFSWEREKKRSL